MKSFARSVARPRPLAPSGPMLSVALSFALSLLASVAGCGGKSESTPRRDWTAHPAVVTLTGSVAIDALGDPHGDVAATARVLSAAGLITASTPYHWTGGPHILVVTGDVIDKGSSALPVIDLLISLEAEARAAGGRVVVTLGNHEAEFLADPTDSKSADFQAELKSRGLDPKKVAAGDSVYGVWLLNRPLAALIDGWFFSHGGNSAGETAEVLARTFQKLIDGPAPSGGRSRYDSPFLIGPNSILEQQLWWAAGGASSIATIDANLGALPAQHIVFGHDPGKIAFSDDPLGERAAGEMVARYQGRLFLIDVGMSSGVGYSQGALLRISREGTDRAAVVLTDGTTAPLWP